MWEKVKSVAVEVLEVDIVNNNALRNVNNNSNEDTDILKNSVLRIIAKNLRKKKFLLSPQNTGTFLCFLKRYLVNKNQK